MEPNTISRRAFLRMSSMGALAAGLGGNLFSLRLAGAAQPSGEEVGYTFCDACNHTPMCGIKFFHQDQVITGIESWPDFPGGRICAKAFGSLQRHYHPNRLKYPLKRTTPKGSSDPGFVRISWDEAYDLAAGHLRRIKKEHGPDAAFFYVGDPKEFRSAVERLASAYGTANYGNESSTACRYAALMAELLTYGFGTTGGLPDQQTKCLLVWGVNPPYSTPFATDKLLDAKRRGVKYIVVDPRKTPVASLADIHLRVRPATTAALAAGLMHVIFRDGLEDKEFCAQWIHGIEELKAYAREFPPERVARICEVPAAQIEEAARLFATTKPGRFFLSAQGTTHDGNAVNNHRSILVLNAICGNLEKQGAVNAETYPLKDMPIWAIGPAGHGLRKDLLARKDRRLDKEFVPAWHEVMATCQTNRMVEWIKEGKVKGFFAWGINLMIWPQTHEYQAAFDQLEFAMAVDYFYRPQTHPHVDLLLPAADNFERLAPFAIKGRKLFARTPLKPLGECREDWRIALDLGCRIADPATFFHGDVVASLDSILANENTSWKELLANLEKGYAVPRPGPELFDKQAAGKLRKDGQPGFATASGKVEALSLVLAKHNLPALPEFREPMATSPEYPLVLVSGTRRPFITHSKMRHDAPWLLELEPSAVMDIHPADAEARGIKDGDQVVLATRWGRITPRARLTILMRQGLVGIMHGWADNNVNELIPRQFDPLSGYPPYKETPCQVSKV